MSGVPNHAITPRELAAVMAAIQAETGAKAFFGCEVHYGKDSTVSLLVTATLEGRVSSAGSPQKYESIQVWPCSTHKTVLGLVYYLLIGAQQQFEAAVTLDALQASP